ncbi:MAG: circularly permuted type 2 ATP-grasp protein [Roseiflexaceae bacterium]|nr:circularly permuted type 2 ATP-grasp protein [Roseiflexaceae bacterium]
MLQQAIDHYHGLLDTETAQDTWAALTSGMRERNLYFGDRPLTTVLRPRLISADQYALLQSACGLVGAACRALADAALQDAELRAGLLLTPLEETLIAMHPGYHEPSVHSRMDTFLTVDGRSLQFVEYNGESPAAIAYEDQLSEVFLDTPVMRAFGQHYTVASLPARQYLLDALLAAWHEFGGTSEPIIAIVDWSGLPTHSEFLLFQRYFAEHGVMAIICTPDDLRFAENRLFARNADASQTPIDLVYKRVLTSELLIHYGDQALDHPLMQAYAAGKICMVNSFRAKLLHKKSIFALLTDDANRHFFTPEQQSAIERHVPWTRIVRTGATTYQGSGIDLIEFARRNQERLLLKPNDEYGGKGIVVGWETPADAWDAALAEALQSPFVIQERVEIAYEDYPALIDGQVQIGRRLVDCDPFMFGNQVQGCLSRLSTVTLLNVTAGGGSTVPVFVVEPKR